jgi:hypothetical protein
MEERVEPVGRGGARREGEAAMNVWILVANQRQRNSDVRATRT